MTVKKRLDYVKKQFGANVAAVTAMIHRGLAGDGMLDEVRTLEPDDADSIYGNLCLGFAARDPSEKYLPWLGLQVHRAFKRENPRSALGGLLLWNAGVKDWIVQTAPDATQLSWDDALDRSGLWHEEMRQAERVPVASDDVGEVVWSNAQGWTLQKLDASQLDAESESMQHCVDGRAYKNAVTAGSLQILSLRDPQNQPHVTFERAYYTGAINQAKGVNNARPAFEVRSLALEAITTLNAIEDPTMGEASWLLPDAEMLAIALSSPQSLSRMRRQHPALSTLIDAMNTPPSPGGVRLRTCAIEMKDGHLSQEVVWYFGDRLTARGTYAEDFTRPRADHGVAWDDERIDREFPELQQIREAIGASEKRHQAGPTWGAKRWKYYDVIVAKTYSYRLPNTFSKLHKFANSKIWLKDLERDKEVLNRMWFHREDDALLAALES